MWLQIPLQAARRDACLHRHRLQETLVLAYDIRIVHNLSGAPTSGDQQKVQCMDDNVPLDDALKEDNEISAYESHEQSPR